MSLLERWLPFMFKRKSADEKKAESNPTGLERIQGPSDPMWPASPASHWMRTFFENPFFSEPLVGFGDPERWFGLPGMDKDDIDLSVENGWLRIRGEKRHHEEKHERGVYRTERYYGYVNRSVPLPDDVDQEQVDAEFDRGVLTVRLPKTTTQPSRGRRIAIKGQER